MATLDIENIILARTFIRPDEYVQSVHYHICYKATKASCLSDYRKGLLDADIQISHRTQVMNMRRGELHKSDQASSGPRRPRICMRIKMWFVDVCIRTLVHSQV